jgi:hypothetical protein
MCSKDKMNDESLLEIKLLVGFVVTTYIIGFFIMINTRFERTVLMKHAFMSAQGMKSMYSDNEKRVYRIGNNIYYLRLDSARRQGTLEIAIKEKRKVRIAGYGINIPSLDMYPIIDKVTII